MFWSAYGRSPGLGLPEKIFADPKDACSQAFCTTVATGPIILQKRGREQPVFDSELLSANYFSINRVES